MNVFSSVSPYITLLQSSVFILCAQTNILTASNSNRSSPACSPVLRKRCRSPTVQSLEGENMVEKGSEQSDTSKSPSTPEQLVTRTYSVQSTRSSSKNSKKSQSWYNQMIL
ncbi:hypothetical protein MHYP_G00128120 [Metynnis hypsauchen]